MRCISFKFNILILLTQNSSINIQINEFLLNQFYYFIYQSKKIKILSYIFFSYQKNIIDNKLALIQKDYYQNINQKINKVQYCTILNNNLNKLQKMYQEYGLQQLRVSSSSVVKGAFDSYSRYQLTDQNKDNKTYEQYLHIQRVKRHKNQASQQQQSQYQRQSQKQQLCIYLCQNKADMYVNPYEYLKQLYNCLINFEQPSGYLLKYLGEIVRVYKLFYGREDLIKKKIFGVNCEPKRQNATNINDFYCNNIQQYLMNSQITNMKQYEANNTQLRNNLIRNRQNELFKNIYQNIEQIWKKKLIYGDQWLQYLLRTIRQLSGWTGSTIGIKTLVGNLKPNEGQKIGIVTYDRMHHGKLPFPFVPTFMPKLQFQRICQSQTRNLVSLIKTHPLRNQDLIQLKGNLYFSLVQKLTELYLQTGKNYTLLNPQIIQYNVLNGKFGIKLEYLLIQGLGLEIQQNLGTNNFMRNYEHLQSNQFRIFLIFLYIEQNFDIRNLTNVDIHTLSDGKWWAKQFFRIQQQNLLRQWQRLIILEENSIQQLELITNLAKSNSIAKYLLLHSMFCKSDSQSKQFKIVLPKNLNFYHQEIHVASLNVSLSQTILNDNNNTDSFTYPNVIVNSYVLHLRHKIVDLIFNNIIKLLKWLQKYQNPNNISFYKQIDRIYWVCYTMQAIAGMELFMTSYQQQNQHQKRNNDQRSQNNICKLLSDVLIKKFNLKDFQNLCEKGSKQRPQFSKLYQYMALTLRKLQYILITSEKININESPSQKIPVAANSPKLSFLYSKHLHNLLYYICNPFQQTPVSSKSLSPLLNIEILNKFTSQPQIVTSSHACVNSFLPLLKLMSKLLLILHAGNANICEYKIYRKMEIYMKNHIKDKHTRENILKGIQEQVKKQEEIFNNMKDKQDVRNILWGTLWKQHIKYQNILDLD